VKLNRPRRYSKSYERQVLVFILKFGFGFFLGQRFGFGFLVFFCCSAVTEVSKGFRMTHYTKDDPRHP
jgi:hypothetical protein